MDGTVLITGAGGFVCSTIAAGLAARGFAVLAMDRHFDDAATQRLGGCRLITAEMEQIGGATAAEHFDILLHGAAITATPADFGCTIAEMIERNFAMTMAALRLAERRSLRRFVSLSSAAVFSAQHPGPLDEAAVPDAIGPYATAKRGSEIAVSTLRAAGLPAVSIRLGNLYGPGETARPSRPNVSLLARMCDAARSGQPIPTPSRTGLREWTFAPDLAGPMSHIITHPQDDDGTVHLCSPEQICDHDLARAVQKRLGGRLAEPAADAPAPRVPLTSRLRANWPNAHWTSLADGLEMLTSLSPQEVAI